MYLCVYIQIYIILSLLIPPTMWEYHQTCFVFGMSNYGSWWIQINNHNWRNKQYLVGGLNPSEKY